MTMPRFMKEMIEFFGASCNCWRQQEPAHKPTNC